MLRLAQSTSRLTLRSAARPLLHARLHNDGRSASEALFDALDAPPPAEEKPPVGPATGYGVPKPIFGLSAAAEKKVDLAPKVTYHLHCHSNRHNTITTFTNDLGNTVAWFSGGTVGFKKHHRGGYEAGYQCAVRSFKRIEREVGRVGEQVELAVYFKGFGPGREALQRALQTSEGDFVRPMVVSFTDRTPIKIGGPRAKKARRS